MEDYKEGHLMVWANYMSPCRVFCDRGEYPCTTLTNASLIMFSLRTSSSNTKFGWRVVLRSHPVALAVPQSCFTSHHQSPGLVSRRPLTLFSFKILRQRFCSRLTLFRNNLNSGTLLVTYIHTYIHTLFVPNGLFRIKR